MARIVLHVLFDGLMTSHAFSEFPISLGRSMKCHLVLPYPFVWWNHARIDWLGDDVVLEVDKQSAQGVYLEGKKVDGRTALANGARFAIHRILIKVEIERGADRRPERSASALDLDLVLPELRNAVQRADGILAARRVSGRADIWEDVRPGPPSSRRKAPNA